MKVAPILSVVLLCALPLAAQTPPAIQPPAANQASAANPSPEAQQIERMKAQLNDWAQLDRYRADNAALLPPAPGEQRVVFYGDSITDFWGRNGRGVFFPGKPYVNRGISGQTTPQMLVRFQQDVVHLKPAVVVILAGINDIAGNTGPSTPEMIEDNFASMAAIAKQNNIKLVISSVLPAIAFPWRPGIQPAEQVRALNVWLKDFCRRDGDVYLDYYSAMADAEGGMKPGLSIDGVHPTAQGYAIMSPLAEKAIAEALESGK
jgi:lysophospholipase L1-like esterase